MAKPMRILFGITSKSHIEIALDEMYGLQDIGYICDEFEFGGKKAYKSAVARLYVLFLNTFKLLIKTYKFKPNFIYLNSRLEFLASARDFITILIIKILYYKKVHFLIKSHGSDLEVLITKKFFFKSIVFPFLNKYVSGWLFLSSEELNWITTNDLLNTNKLFLTKNIVRLEKFQVDNMFREKLDIPKDCTILLFVGRLIKEKGIHYVIDSYVEVRDRFKVFLIIVGDGQELAAVTEKIEQLNIKNDVLVTEWIDENEVAYYTSNSDVLIFPTFFPEGFPMVLFNSLAAGLAIITTPIRAAYDYLEDPKNCLWVEPRSSISITKALDKLLVDNHLKEQMQINNMKKVQLFIKEIVSQELSSILKSIKSRECNKNFQEDQKKMVNANCV